MMTTPKRNNHVWFLLLLTIIKGGTAFIQNTPQRHQALIKIPLNTPQQQQQYAPPKSSTILFESSKKENKDNIDPSVRSKLVAESIAPWRTIRLFLYASLGSGALLGGFITLSGVAAGWSGARTDIDFDTEYLNLAIDFGAAILFGIFAKLDLSKGEELNTSVETKLSRKKENASIKKAMRERESRFQKLTLRIQTSDDGSSYQDASVAGIQEGAKQHVVLVVGNRSYVKDAVLGARLLKLDYAMKDVLVVPYVLEDEGLNMERRVRPEGGGFGSENEVNWYEQPFVARAVGMEEWRGYVGEEIEDAIQQNNNNKKVVEEEGIAIAVKNNGRVVRRGLGSIPWRTIVEELEGKEEEGEMADLSFLDQDLM